MILLPRIDREGMRCLNLGRPAPQKLDRENYTHFGNLYYIAPIKAINRKNFAAPLQFNVVLYYWAKPRRLPQKLFRQDATGATNCQLFCSM